MQLEMLQSILDTLESHEKVWREEHEAVMAKQEQLPYFQCHVRERVAVV